jgi:hypothetical protein
VLVRVGVRPPVSVDTATRGVAVDVGVGVAVLVGVDVLFVGSSAGLGVCVKLGASVGSSVVVGNTSVAAGVLVLVAPVFIGAISPARFGTGKMIRAATRLARITTATPMAIHAGRLSPSLRYLRACSLCFRDTGLSHSRSCDVLFIKPDRGLSTLERRLAMTISYHKIGICPSLVVQ